MKKLSIFTLLFSAILFSCSKKIDSSSLETYQSSLTAIKSELSEKQKDSLSKCIGALVTNSGYSILDMEKIMKDFDGMTAKDIFQKGGYIIERKKYVKDSTRQAFVKDSIETYSRQGNWQVKYFVDDFQEPTKEGYLQIISTGVFTNSATTNSELSMKVIVDQDKRVQIMLYEYGNIQVKSSSRDGSFYSLKILNSDSTYNGEGFFYSDRVTFSNENLELMLSTIKNGGKAKIYLREQSKYSSPSSYLAEFDFTNFEKAFKILNKEV